MKRTLKKLTFLGFAGWLAMASVGLAQTRPHIGYTYPAGGQQGTTFQIKLGGQGLDDVNAVIVSGAGVSARVADYFRRLNNQEIQLLNEQLKILRRTAPAAAATMMGSESPMLMMSAMAAAPGAVGSGQEGSAQLIARIEKRTREWVQTPACVSIASLVIVEVTIAPDAAPGARELRLATPRGVSNPLAFHVGQLTEYSRRAMTTATIQVLGKEAQALRKRPVDEIEDRIAIPCTVNGQIASGEVNRYRFSASKGQRLVISAQGRQLIPYIADAVPGWFQPVLALYDAQGREVAFADDYRFKPDPVILYQVPQDGEYVFAIHDSIYRGREDFVYRITVGEVPFVTSLFPLGGQAGAASAPKMKGWNLEDAALALPREPAEPGIQTLAARRKGIESNPVPFVVDRLRDAVERENNNSETTAQKVVLPVVVNGRIDRPDDWDVFQIAGRAGEKLVAEVQARRLDSPLDSVLKLTDATGKLVAFSDDREDLAAGVNTHHADASFVATLPTDGIYYVHIGDTARKGGEEYGYRLRLSAPRPDFELRVVPSSASLRTNASAAVSVYATRHDGFAGPIKVTLKDPPPGFSAAPVILTGSQTVARFNFKGGPAPTKEPVRLSIVGSTKMGNREIVRAAVPAEDRMQAFLWRHLVPASDLLVMVFDPAQTPPPKRVAPVRPVPAVAGNAVPVASVSAEASASVTANATAPAKPKFSKQQIVGRLRQLKLLYEEGLLTDEFYDQKVTECEVGQ
jgi:hypothetical protein